MTQWRTFFISDL